MPSDDPEYNAVIDWYGRRSSRAAGKAMMDLDEDPDKAARAYQQSKDLGIPATAASVDPDGFDQQYRKGLVGSLIRNNKYLQKFVESHELASKVAADDWPNLDKIDETLKNAYIGDPFFESLERVEGRDRGSKIGRAFVQGFSEAAGTPPDIATKENLKNLREYLGERGLQRLDLDIPAYGVALGFEALNKLLAGTLRGIDYATQQAVREYGGDEAQATQWGAAFGAAAEYFATDLARHGGKPHVTEPMGAAFRLTNEYRKLTGAGQWEAAREVRQTIEAVRAAKPYLEQGKRPPNGLHPYIDAFNAELAKWDEENLAKIDREVEKSATRQRAPDIFAKGIEARTGEGYIEIDPRAIAKLYGDKLPGPEDGLLGFQPDLAVQFYDAMTGGDMVRIKLSDWHAHAAKEVKDALRGDIAVRPGNYTGNEAKELKPQAEVPTEPVEEIGTSDAARTQEAIRSVEKQIKLAAPSGWDVVEPGISLEPSFITGFYKREAEWIRLSRSSYAQIKPEDWTPEQHQMHAEITKAIKQMAPEAVEVVGAKSLKLKGQPVTGLYVPYTDRMPMLLWAWESLDPMGTARHEVIHHLRQYGFLNQQEWEVLRTAAISNRWIQGHRIKERYPGAELGTMIEEAVAEEFKHWRRTGATDPAVHPIFEKLKQLYDRIREIITDLFGQRPTVDQIFSKIERGVVGKRKPTPLDARYWREPIEPKAEVPPQKIDHSVDESPRGIRTHTFTIHVGEREVASAEIKEGDNFVSSVEVEPEFRRQGLATQLYDEIEKQLGVKLRRADVQTPEAEAFWKSRLEEKAEVPEEEPPRPYDPGALMPKVRGERYWREIQKKRAETHAKQIKDAQADYKREHQQDWRDAAAELYPEIESRIKHSPGFLLNRMIRYKGKDKVGIDPRWLTKEERESIPKQYLMMDGLHPDQLAGMVGLSDGIALLETIRQFEEGKGDLKPSEYLKQEIGKELQRRLDQEFGKSPEAIMEAALDHVYGGTNFELLHQDTLYMADLLGQEFSLSKQDVVRQNRERFNRTKVKDVSYDRTNTALHRAATQLEDALLKKDHAEAYRLAQQKEHTFAFGREIKKFNREMTSFRRLVKFYGKREPENRKSFVTNFIHQILQNIGESRRGIGDINIEISYSPFKNLREFVDKVNEQELLATGSQKNIIPVADFLQDGEFKTPVDQMTVAEFRAVHDAVKALDKWSKEEQIYLSKKGEEILRNMIDDQLIPAIKDVKTKRLVESGQLEKPVGMTRKGLQTYWAQSMVLETIFNTYDRNNPYGPFNQHIIRHYVEAINQADAWDKEFGRMWKKLPSIRLGNRVVKQSLFLHPRTGEPLQMTRSNILAVLQNMGNPSNFETMMRGYQIPRERWGEVYELVAKNTFPEDWERAKILGDIFNKAKDLSDNMYREVSGVAPTRIDTWEITSPEGKKYEGWYHPLMYERLLPQTSPKLAEPSPLEFPYWTKSNLPAAGYTKQRTGYYGPISLEMDGFQNRLKMMIRDAAVRPAILQLQKVFKDDAFRTAIREHHGPHVEALLDPFLRDLAGNREALSDNQAVAAKVIQFARSNIISHYVGLSPMTFAKHETTVWFQSLTEARKLGFLKELATIIGQGATLHPTEWQFAVSKSLALQRRYHNYWETISGNFQRTYGDLAIAPDMQSFIENFRGRNLTEGFKLALNDASGRYLRIRDAAHFVEAWPLGFFDLVSSVPTWLTVYKDAMRANPADEGMAIFLADRAVRRSHGSTEITNRPEMVRRINPVATMFTAYYTMFSHILQRQYEATWMARMMLRREGWYVKSPTVDRATGKMSPPEIARAEPGRSHEEEGPDYKNTANYKTGLYLAKALAGSITVYALLVPAVEEFYDPIPWEPNEPWWSHYGKVGLRGWSGSWLGLREVGHAAIESNDPAAGLYSTAGREVMRFAREPAKPHTTRQDQQRLLRYSNDVWNSVTGVGVPHAPMKMGIFGYNWYMGYEHPQSVREWWTGITKGETHPRHK